MIIPCERCVSLAICKYRETIECSVVNNGSTYNTSNKILDELLKLFPRCKCILLNPPDEPVRFITERQI